MQIFCTQVASGGRNKFNKYQCVRLACRGHNSQDVRNIRNLLPIVGIFFLYCGMTQIRMTGHASSRAESASVLYCPSLVGLTAVQADLAIVMPRLDHNRKLRETPCQGRWAAILACDPFGSEAALFRDLASLGYTGLANWPSTILLDGETRQAMSTIPATPEHEYAALARAQDAGWDTLAFFRSLDQAREALSAGLRQLVLHPGLLDADSNANSAMITAALNRLCHAVRTEMPGVEIRLFSSDWHDRFVAADDLSVDGIVRLETGL